MAWVVNTVVLLDIHSADPAFAQASAECLVTHSADGLTISPVTYVELAPAFDGDAALQEQFFAELGIEWPAFWAPQDIQTAQWTVGGTRGSETFRAHQNTACGRRVHRSIRQALPRAYHTEPEAFPHGASCRAVGAVKERFGC